ncbi:acyl-CoA dehydrogenase, partial [Aureobasidium melanogenum]
MDKAEIFGDLAPWAEPAWYTTLASPYYNDSHRELRKAIRSYVDKHVLPYEEEWEENGQVPKEATLGFVKAGLVLQDFPRKYRDKANVQYIGGVAPEDYDVFHYMVLHDELSRIRTGVQAGLAGASSIGAPPVLAHGTGAQKDAWLPGIFTGEISFCLGATEPTGGSDLANLRTTAQKTPDGRYYIVNGHKKWITGALSATHMTTAVRTGGTGAQGVSVLVIPTSSEGFSARKIKNSGNNAGNSSWVTLENVKVPVTNLIGKENAGFKVLMTNFNKERFLIAVAMNRQARTCLSTAFTYAQDRITFGKPLFSNQVIRHKLANVAKDIEAHWAWIEQIAYHVKVNGWTDDVASRIAMAKIFGGRMLELACREAQQVLGGVGYQRNGVGGAVEQISRDLRVMVVGGGSEEIIGDLAVRQELALTQRKEKLNSRL